MIKFSAVLAAIGLSTAVLADEAARPVAPVAKGAQALLMVSFTDHGSEMDRAP